MFMSCRWVYQSLIRIDMWVKKTVFFLLNIISCVCLAGSGLDFVFHWKAHSLVFSSSWLRSFAEASMSWTTENKDVSPANNLQLLLISFDKSIIYISKITKVPIWILVVHGREYQPKTNADHLKRLFALYCLGSPLKY